MAQSRKVPLRLFYHLKYSSLHYHKTEDWLHRLRTLKYSTMALLIVRELFSHFIVAAVRWFFPTSYTTGETIMFDVEEINIWVSQSLPTRGHAGKLS